MADLSDSISALVDEFVTQVTALARKAAMDTLSSAIGGAAQTGAGRSNAPRRSVAPGRAVSRDKGQKRPAAELDQLKQTVLDHITANPGQRIEQIKKDLGRETRELALPIKKLIAEGAVRSEGEKRATAYFPASGKRSKKAA